MKSTANEQRLAREAVRRALSYLRSCNLRVPEPVVSTIWHGPLGGSQVVFDGNRCHLNMGRYPTAFLRDWFAMHELGHVLWFIHQPRRWQRFRESFGAPRPREYQQLHAKHSWKTASTHRLSRIAGPHRPAGEPSWYGATAGGDERFCELLALMHANGDFSKPAPSDLAGLWETCWDHGLSRMV